MSRSLPIVPSVTENLGELQNRFSTAQPFPHLVFEEFLDPSLLARLHDEFPDFDAQRAANELGHIRGKAVHEQISTISAAYHELHEIIQTTEFLNTISKMTGIPDLLFDPEYFGGGTHENLTGQGLHYHVDFNYHPIRKWHRRLNLIIFLNHEWQREWGGNLQLHRDAWVDEGDADVEVLPEYGRAIIFETSERSWHGFEQITAAPNGGRLSRRSIALYFYSATRPNDQVTAEHGTYYVGRPLPDWLVEGATISKAQLDYLQEENSLQRDWVSYLYDREVRWSTDFGRLNDQIREQSEQIKAVERSSAYRLGRLLTAPARLLRRD
jgi:Rps23 Pro-64 3,4-dihydroxylase Tpa1-like proline 4-hydroxylase